MYFGSFFVHLQLITGTVILITEIKIIAIIMQTYTYEEAFQASMNYFGGDELAARVWVNKYAMKDSFGVIYEQSPADMHRRMAREIARIEQKYACPMTENEIFGLLDHFRFIVPAGSPMTGIGGVFPRRRIGCACVEYEIRPEGQFR